MSDNPCEGITTGELWPGGPVVLKVENGNVTVGGIAVGGFPVVVEFGCEGFLLGLYALLDALGIPHP